MSPYLIIMLAVFCYSVRRVLPLPQKWYPTFEVLLALLFPFLLEEFSTPHITSFPSTQESLFLLCSLILNSASLTQKLVSGTPFSPTCLSHPHIHNHKLHIFLRRKSADSDHRKQKKKEEKLRDTTNLGDSRG